MESYVDKKLFSEACQHMIGALQGQNGIGTLREKTIHSVLKYYYAPDPCYHEIRIGNYVADEFKEACEKAGVSQAAQISKMMREFIDEQK